MSKHSINWTDRRTEIIIGNLLRFGVILSAAVVIIGAIIYLARHWNAGFDYSTFNGNTSALRTVPGIVSGVLSLSGRAIIQLGLLLVIAIPIARVVFSVIAFALERDFLYIGITLIVLAVLLFSLV